MCASRTSSYRLIARSPELLWSLEKPPPPDNVLHSCEDGSTEHNRWLTVAQPYDQ
jgi:hypothetical protein